MLFNIVIDPDALVLDSSSRSARDVLRNAVDRFGVLNTSRDEITKMLSRLSDSPTEKSLWREVLLRVPKQFREPPLPERADFGPLEIPAGEATTLALSDQRAERWFDDLGFDVASQQISTDAAIEMLRIDAITESTHLESRTTWSQADLGSTVTGRAVWEDRLRPLFRTATGVSLVDRYLLKKFETRTEGKPGACGLPWLLDCLGADTVLRTRPMHRLELFALEPDPPWCESDMLDRIMDDLWHRCASAVSELRLAVLGERDFSVEHGRYLRFSGQRSNRVVRLDHSLDMFCDGLFSTVVGFSYRLISGGDLAQYQRTEDRLTSMAERRSRLLVRDHGAAREE